MFVRTYMFFPTQIMMQQAHWLNCCHESMLPVAANNNLV